MSAANPRVPESRHAASVFLDWTVIADMLDLPDELRIVAFEATNDPTGLHVIIEGPGLPEVQPYAEAPRAWLHATVYQFDPERDPESLPAAFAFRQVRVQFPGEL